MLNEDYKDILQTLLNEKVEFIIVGAYAMAAHGYPRATGDLDLWVKPEADNSAKVFKALKTFGVSMHERFFNYFYSGCIKSPHGISGISLEIL